MTGGARAAIRRSQLWRAPVALRWYLIGVQALAVALAVPALLDFNLTPHKLGTLALLGVTAVGFEEGARRAARLKIRLGSALRTDMTSVWAVAAAVSMDAWSAVVLLVVVSGYLWFRQFRPAGEALYRKSATAAMAIIACLLAGDAFRAAFAAAGSLPWLLAGFVSVLAAMAVQESVNRLLVTVALLILRTPVRELLADVEENLIELATLCLGGLVALAVLYEPWLVVLALAPMYALQRGALVRELETAATTDGKTGLLNAIAWEQLAERELARARREGYSLAVLIVDIDRFKRVNDDYGHLVGDQVLRRVGRTIAAEVREYDGVGRFGGEEFVAVLPDVDTTAALMIAERVRNRINQLRVSTLLDAASDGALGHVADTATDPATSAADDGDAGRHDVLSVSIGVSCTESGDADVPVLLREADAALYRAKDGGRNRVVLADRGFPQLPERATH